MSELAERIAKALHGHLMGYPCGDDCKQLRNEVNDVDRILSEQWQPIETAPKAIVYRVRNYGHEYGARILAWPVFGEVARVRWWQNRDSSNSNFIEDGGNAAHPTHWRPLPAPPKAGA